jgi:CDP-diacylglycerol--glycerol-3-phosphate 3-phosphatidyltransferase
LSLDRPAFLRRWSALHDGIDPDGVPFVRGWLSVVYVAARPFAAARVPPSVVTLTGLVVAGAVPLVTWAGDEWALAAAVLVLVSALFDSLDGAVAVMTDRVTPWGAVLDAVCDRLADAAYGVALWVLGAPAWLVLVCIGLSSLTEYARARGQALLAAPLDVVTVGERPTRIIVTFVTLLAAGIVSSRAGDLALIGGVVGSVTAAVGLTQLMFAVRRRLT